MVAEAVLNLLSQPQSIRDRGEIDFILCVGDDRSDEDMFQTVKRFRDHAMESPTPEVSPMSMSHEQEVRWQGFERWGGGGVVAILHTQTGSGAYSRDSSRFPQRCSFVEGLVAKS